MRMISTVSLALALVAILSLETRGASPAPWAITYNGTTITPAAAASRTVGTNIQFVVSASGSAGSLTFQMDFGDGTPTTSCAGRQSSMMRSSSRHGGSRSTRTVVSGDAVRVSRFAVATPMRRSPKSNATTM